MISASINIGTLRSTSHHVQTGPRSAVGRVSGNRCESAYRYGGREFDPGWRLITKKFLQSFSSLPLNPSRRVVVSYKQKYVPEVLVKCLFKIAQKKM